MMDHDYHDYHDYDGDESESDLDSVEEVQIKHFCNRDFSQGIKQAKSMYDSHAGIKRHPGYYKV